MRPEQPSTHFDRVYRHDVGAVHAPGGFRSIELNTKGALRACQADDRSSSATQLWTALIAQLRQLKTGARFQLRPGERSGPAGGICAAILHSQLP